MFKGKANPNVCAPCPYKYNKEGCPFYVLPGSGFLETDIATGQERLLEGCYFQVMPKMMRHVVVASNRPAAAFDKLATLVCEIGLKITPEVVKKHLANNERKRLNG